MMALETGIVWGADVVMLQEPYVEREGYNISHPGYRLVRGGRTMTAIRRDTHLEFSEVDKGGDGDVQVFDIRYPSGRKMRLVNVYDQLRQEGGVRSQGRPAQTARWREIMEQEKILLGGDSSAKVQIDYRLRYAHMRTRAAYTKLPVDPCATRSL